MAILRRLGQKCANVLGAYVLEEPIDAALVAAASTDQVVAKKADGTLYLKTVSGGGGGGVTVLYDSGVLVSPANAIDTGVAGIAGGFDVLELWMLLRTDEAVALSGLSLRFNNDSGGNYDGQYVRGANTTASAALPEAAGTGISIGAAGASSGSDVFSVFRGTVPFYTETTAHKMLEMTDGNAQATGANARAYSEIHRWRSTAAITRLSVTAPATKNFIAGSHLIVYGR